MKIRDPSPMTVHFPENANTREKEYVVHANEEFQIITPRERLNQQSIRRKSDESEVTMYQQHGDLSLMIKSDYFYADID